MMTCWPASLTASTTARICTERPAKRLSFVIGADGVKTVEARSIRSCHSSRESMDVTCATSGASSYGLTLDSANPQVTCRRHEAFAVKLGTHGQDRAGRLRLERRLTKVPIEFCQEQRPA